mmetsp:Transcript_30947/g.30424  ORF Transcript_30947/g.30424 Transcript_30947/m.30424 type:complete len:109 (+) Transcript_30947:346-672(+)
MKKTTTAIWDFKEVDFDLELNYEQQILSKRSYFYVQKKHTYFLDPYKAKYQENKNDFFLTEAQNEEIDKVKPTLRFLPESELMHQMILKLAFNEKNLMEARENSTDIL